MFKYIYLQNDLNLSSVLGFKSLEHFFDEIFSSWYLGLDNQCYDYYALLTEHGKLAFINHAISRDPQFKTQVFIEQYVCWRNEFAIVKLWKAL